MITAPGSAARALIWSDGRQAWPRLTQGISDGGFVTTEPVGSEDWMPLNDYPTAKPTYDFYDTVNAGKTAVANGVLESVTRHAPGARFPGGSATWHWHSRAPIASYLVEDSVGNYTLASRTGSDGIRYYHITEPQLEADFRHWLPSKSAACENRLSQFFTQWFDTAYPSGGGTSKPAITGPGLADAGFYDSSGGCPA
jgi:hypothetical protein